VTDGLLFTSFTYLVAAVVAVPIAKRFGLGSVLGYLIAGVLIGPAALNVVGSSEQVMKFAEFGVVMMLFLIGLELRPSLLWRLRVPIVGLGGLQVAGTALAISGTATTLGLGWKGALAVGLILAMSSTAIVLQSLSERGQLKLTAGQSCFSVLLFQDIAVIPILALLPLLGRGGDAGESHGFVAHLPAWQRALATLGAVAILVIAGRYLLRYVFRYVAASRLRELFTELTLVLVIGITLLMEAVGLSAALGAFVAGLMLADSEYRHQLEADIEPFKGILLGVFFTSVGARIDFGLIASQPGVIASLVAGLVAIKFAVQVVLARAFHHDGGQSVLFGLALAQGGEFCFVLLNMAGGLGVFEPVVTQTLVAVVALSMAVTPFLFVLNDRVLQPMFIRGVMKSDRQPDVIPEQDNPVILAGFGRFGHIVGRLLRANGIPCTVLENDPEQIETLGRFGLKAYYGDASRSDLLHAAGAARAKLFICTLADEEKSVRLVKLVQQEFPHLRILARAVSRQHAYDLLRAGVDDIFRETLGSALDLGVKAMREMGFRAVQAVRAARIFKEYDEASVRDLVKYLDDDARYTSEARQHMENLERLLQADREGLAPAKEDAWEIGAQKKNET
jgi:monovalent cation:proton antiporter-2 (CPA2) family protein